MNTRTVTRLRGAGKAALAALLVLLLIFSAMAAGSSSLHNWLHSDHGSPSHYCLVSLLDHGHGHAPAEAARAVRTSDTIVEASRSADTSFFSIDRTLPSGRGPPCLS